MEKPSRTTRQSPEKALFDCFEQKTARAAERQLEFGSGLWVSLMQEEENED